MKFLKAGYVFNGVGFVSLVGSVLIRSMSDALSNALSMVAIGSFVLSLYLFSRYKKQNRS